MPSSTSSSEPRRIPIGDWRATWIVAIVIAIAMTWWFEHVTRSHGQRPSVVDDPVWWSVSRRMVDDDPRVVAFVGTSRMELAYSAQTFAEVAPELHGVQLSINAVAAIGVLEDLADDEQFRGIAIVDIIEWDITWGDPYETAKPYTDRAHALWRAPGALANRYLASLVQERLAVLAVGGRPLITSVLGKRRWPLPTWVVAERDRTSHGAYVVADRLAIENKRDRRYPLFAEAEISPDAWLERARGLEPLIQRIRAHGGDVVIVHMPVSGKLAELFEQHYPRRLYWDVFAARSSAHVLHFRDVPGMAGLASPDEMHLDQRDQAAFTRSLVEAVRAMGVLRRREP